MINKTLYAAREFLRRHPTIKRTVALTNFNKLGRRVYERKIASGRVVDLNLAGKPLKFSVTTVREEYDLEFIPREEGFMRQMLNALEPNDVIFDVGANLGLVSLRIAAEEKNLTVHSFEPEPGNAAALRRAIALNNCEDNVTVHRLALAESEGTEILHVARRSGSIHTLMNSFVNDNFGNHDRVVVNVTSMSLFAATHQLVPTFVKIDVEGAELRVLKGMESLLLERSIREIFIEIHLGGSRDKHQELIEGYLSRRGYHCRWSAARGTEVHQHWSRIKEGGQ